MVLAHLPQKKKNFFFSIHSLSYPSIHNFSPQPLSNLGELALKEVSILSRHWWNQRETTLSWKQDQAITKRTFLNEIYTHAKLEAFNPKNLPKLTKRETYTKIDHKKTELNEKLVKSTFSTKRNWFDFWLGGCVVVLMKWFFFWNSFGKLLATKTRCFCRRSNLVTYAFPATPTSSLHRSIHIILNILIPLSVILVCSSWYCPLYHKAT